MAEKKKIVTRAETVGKASVEARQKQEDTRDPIEIQRAMQEDYIDELLTCVESHISLFPHDFFVVVITKRERLMPNVFRNYFFARQSCPTPDYDQTVFWYHAQDQVINYLWCIPDKETCITFKENALHVVEEERALLQHILDFADGTLFAVAQKINKEQRFTPFLES